VGNSTSTKLAIMAETDNMFARQEDDLERAEFEGTNLSTVLAKLIVAHTERSQPA
jgi:hypothetical protein